MRPCAVPPPRCWPTSRRPRDTNPGDRADVFARAIEAQCAALQLELRALQGEPAVVQELALRVLTCLEERRRASA